MKILFLAANPQSTSRLNLGQEVQEIEEGLKRSKLADRFQLAQRWEVRPRDLRRALLEENPDIVHFSGHGKGKEGLVLVDRAGKPKPATGEALAGLFIQFPSIKCVLLNACYAEIQAKAIVQHIDYVIGMKDTILDDAAIAFTTGFYDGLGYGRDIEDAFELGKNAILWELASFSDTTRQMIPVDFTKTEAETPLPENLKPILLKRSAYLNPQISFVGEAPNTNLSPTPNQKPIQQYQKRVQEYLANRNLTPIAKFQLATLAKQLEISESAANDILQTELAKIEQAKQDYQKIFKQTLEQGYNLVNPEIKKQLQELQANLNLLDLEVAEISNSIFQKQAKTHYQKGKSHYELKEYHKAIADYTKAIRLNPQYTNAYINRGASHKNLKEYHKAIADFNEAIRLDSQYAIAYINRGDIYGELKEYHKAIVDFNEAIRLDPQYAIVYIYRGASYGGLGKYQKALQDFQQAANLYQQQGKPEYYQKIINLIERLEKR